jgi:uncharacterized membrane protein (UPF0127 family)
MRLTKADGTVVAEPLEIASNLWTQGMGLMGRKSLPATGGMLIESCSGIHMMFMRFPIDAVFMDKAGRVLKVYNRLRPWIGMVPLVWKANRVAELPAGAASRLAIKPGDTLTVAA